MGVRYVYSQRWEEWKGRRREGGRRHGGGRRWGKVTKRLHQPGLAFHGRRRHVGGDGSRWVGFDLRRPIYVCIMYIAGEQPSQKTTLTSLVRIKYIN